MAVTLPWYAPRGQDADRHNRTTLERRLVESHEANPASGDGANWHYLITERELRFSLHVFEYPDEAAYRLRVFHYFTDAAGESDELELWRFEDGSFQTSSEAVERGTQLVSDFTASQGG